ncbi:type II toxin-antitoxin system HicB family antitoxin [Neokomagataea thailandica]|uniref:CopG family DNA-binding protein n=1 Tax=Neokomagataea tanensis NBRC 106556 TaxID=1223519 RepID=A0ABQ0QID6_9PROT|nr:MULTISPECIES: type II toxin-antitoxin system HicB family antitoxin [Neokomagataea]GBR45944.1 CopG family DNA-binding protein [Neokomagataea tanensis NBRC 106556]
MRYPIVIEHGTDTTAYGVIVPDLPGCCSAGDTLDEAITNALEAIALWIETALDDGQSIRQPSALEELRALSEWRGPEWIWGFVQVDPAIFDEKAERVNITLPRRVLARLDSRAKEAGETRSGFIAKLAISA